MAKKVYTCNVFFMEKSGYYNSVDDPDKLAQYLDGKNYEWKYLNVYEKDKMAGNKCGAYLRRIYSKNYQTQKK